MRSIKFTTLVLALDDSATKAALKALKPKEAANVMLHEDDKTRTNREKATLRESEPLVDIQPESGEYLPFTWNYELLMGRWAEGDRIKALRKS